ncbi:uncharacterized protein LOC126311208 [Schistocerca gregaria]|uniref:uncharacterized protein LOC126311208 n=1 Tax=Schistocerca gregaria TaxID=7010 RepID=UPI00211E8B96|nr:uncharacterized protein LOC126311208 [Schistocerca gregaria]
MSHTEADAENAQPVTTQPRDQIPIIKFFKSKSLFQQLDATMRQLNTKEQVIISGLESTLSTVVSVAQKLKSLGCAEISEIKTEVIFNDDYLYKHKMSIVLTRTPNFSDVYEKRQMQAEETKQLKKQLAAARMESQEFFRSLTEQQGTEEVAQNS